MRALIACLVFSLLPGLALAQSTATGTKKAKTTAAAKKGKSSGKSGTLDLSKLSVPNAQTATTEADADEVMPLDVSNMLFDSHSIRQVVQHYMPHIQSCYEKVLATSGQRIEGRVSVGFIIDVTGTVLEARALPKKSTVSDERVIDCVHKEYIMDTIQILLSLAVCLFVGLMLTRVLKPLHLPDVTAYLIGGVLIGAYCLGRFTLGGFAFGFNNEVAPTEAFAIISDIALGFIAFDIGNEFRVKDLKKIGKQATIIGIIQAVTATVFVDAALIGLHFILLASTGVDYLPLPACILLGAIASATAPAATLMVVRQYKAKGKLTDLLLPIVALDDAVGLIIFAISLLFQK